jgi:hypothetical protein
MRIPRPANRVRSGVVSDREAFTMLAFLALIMVGAILEIAQMSATQVPLP